LPTFDFFKLAIPSPGRDNYCDAAARVIVDKIMDASTRRYPIDQMVDESL